MDIRTIVDLQDALDKEMSWRLKEIKAFQMASKSSGPDRKYFIRAGIALLYAHWEGFIKTSSEHYLNFVGNKNLSYKDLKTCFALFGLKAKLQTLTTSRSSVPNIEAFEFITGHLEQRAKLKLAAAINTEANLTSKVFTNIASSIAINVEPYASRFHLIDESLVRRRNMVAHGEHLELKGREFGELLDDILQIMREYKTDLENAASQSLYRRS